MKYSVIGLYLLFSLLTFGQEQDILQVKVIDSLYREDQIYIGFTYNIMDNRPIDLKQNFFSPGINFGFLRDFPINKKRTVAIAPGFGFSYSGYNQNLLIQKTNNEINYSVVSSTEFNRNNYVVADSISERNLGLPFFRNLKKLQLNRINAAISEFTKYE